MYGVASNCLPDLIEKHHQYDGPNHRFDVYTPVLSGQEHVDELRVPNRFHDWTNRF